MELCELINGDVVILRNGSRYMLVDDTFVGCETKGYLKYKIYDNNMLIKRDQTMKYSKDELDIMKVYRNTIPFFNIVNNDETLIYEREFNKWNSVKRNTKILVKNRGELEWNKRYFAKYENGKVWAYPAGATSWSNEDKDLTTWELVRIAEED